MSRRCMHARIWGPFALAAACFALRALPEPLRAEPPRPRAVALPALYGARAQERPTRYELDPERSSVRFLVEGPRGALWCRCTRIAGELSLGPTDQDGALALRIDLSSLAPLPTQATDLDVRHVAGVLGDVELAYRGGLASTATTDLPGVSALLWSGTIQFGARVLRQPMLLWRASLPGRPLRLQGHGSVDGDAFGLPTRTWFGLFDEHHAVTLGLDLAWRRARER